MKKRILASTAVLLMLGATAQAQQRTLTISVYAFAQDAYDKIVYQPFEKECGCKLVVETGNSAERLAKMDANKANPVIDMAVMSMADACPPRARVWSTRSIRRSSPISPSCTTSPRIPITMA